MEIKTQIQEIGNNVETLEDGHIFPVLMNRKTAAKYMKIPEHVLREWENVGIQVGDNVSGYTKVMYWKSELTSDKVRKKYQQWKEENPLLYAELKK